VAEVFLEVALVDLGRRGEISARRVPGELLLPIAFGEIAANAGGDLRSKGRALWAKFHTSAERPPLDGGDGPGPPARGP
jgi:hypothetical protein